MKELRIYKTAYFFLLSNIGAISVANPYNFIHTRKCKDYWDDRSKDKWKREVVLPERLTHRGAMELTLKMTKAEGERCNNSEELTISFDKDEIITKDEYKLQDAGEYVNEVYFTDDGYLHRRGQYENPNDFCIKLISDDALTLRICPANCTADLSNTYLYAKNPESVGFGTPRVCIPKCCGVDEILSITDFTCRPINSNEPTYFLPYLHLPHPPSFPQEGENLVRDQVLVIPKNVRNSRLNFNSSASFNATDDTIWEYLHFRRSLLNCSRLQWQGVYFRDAENWGRDRKNRYSFRVAVDNETAKLEFLTFSRRWVPGHRTFCVEGLQEWHFNKTDGAMVGIVVVCADDVEKGGSLTELGVGLHLPDNEGRRSAPGKFALLGTLCLCSVALCLGFLMYCRLATSLSVYGKIIASHLGCVSGLYSTRFLAELMSLLEYFTRGSNAVIIVTAHFDGYRRIGWFCVYVGVSSHYLYLSSILWLSCLNSDAWSKLKGFGKTYWIYGTLGWLVPAMLVATAGYFDYTKNDPWLDVVVPDYGVETCAVASWSSIYYLYLPFGIILLFNVTYILMKMTHYWINSRSAKKTTECEGLNEGIPFQVFAIICGIQILYWIVTHESTANMAQQEKIKFNHLWLLCVITLLETGILLYIYCLNEVVFTLLAERVTWMWGVVSYLKEKEMFTSRSVECAFVKEKRLLLTETNVVETRH